MIILDLTKEVTLPDGRKFAPSEFATGYSSFGRTPCTATCGYCGTDNETTLWSISGSGKRCYGCFALVTRSRSFPPTAADLSRLTKRDERRSLWAQALKK